MTDFVPVLRTPPTMAPTMTRGPENVSAIRVVADVRDDFYWYAPDAAAFTTVSNRLKRKRTVSQREFHWLTKDEYPRFLDIAVASNAADVTLDVAAGQGTRAGTRFLYQVLRTGEVVLVTGVAADVLTVTRGIGSVAQDIIVGDRLHFLGTAFEDGTGKGQFKSTVEADEFNFTQIIKTSYGFTGRQLATKMYGGKDPMTERRAQGIEHAKSVEKVLWWGRRHKINGTTTTHETTFAGGIDSYVNQTWDLGNNIPTERQFTEFLEFAMKWGSSGSVAGGSRRKFGFFSSRWVTEIEMFGKNILREVPGSEKTLGMSIKAYRSTHGDLFIIPTHILDESHPDHGFVLDMQDIAYVTHAERPTRLYKNVEQPDLDGEEELYMSDVSVEVALTDGHFKLRGIPV